ncbi:MULTISPECIES: HAD family hydrolase [Streptomyces]|uniref:Hydrolase of the HAD superfamily n=2 Tax=Streptomyces TaxID=1883 RepID=A0ABU0QAI3_STRAH|nr:MULTISPECIES: HAD family phosphatase [Streptomyces]MBP5896537.1 HAD family phosphatase [Streptomyces sp. LBUM 1481]MCZ4516528.1 HAD family phosphatase [Streptomyces sp. ActVer]MDQ0687176.1 putative hydrolase of the HAD superfamily [Streptomyces achromogenes]MDX3114918.1 HAD family phosphatase [Streptomyces scabiei]MDX3244273.1 HAD family phosphatase [Streptomyces sp. ME18-1-4]
MTRTSASPTGVDALILDYNGVLGLQPSTAMWTRLADLAEWPDRHLPSFQDAFWAPRNAYDAGELSDLAYWAKVLGHHPGPRWLRTLRAADTAMWTRTDPCVLDVLYRARAAELPMVLLSNAPAHLSDVLDATVWRRELMDDALYSARLGLCKPDPAAYEHALAATGVAEPARVLFVDDREDNCRAAAQLDLRTLHYTGQSAYLERQLLPALAASTGS